MPPYNFNGPGYGFNGPGYSFNAPGYGVDAPGYGFNALNTDFQGLSLSERVDPPEPQTPESNDARTGWSPSQWNRHGRNLRTPLASASKEKQAIAKQEMAEHISKTIDARKSAGGSSGALAESKYSADPGPSQPTGSLLESKYSASPIASQRGGGLSDSKYSNTVSIPRSGGLSESRYSTSKVLGDRTGDLSASKHSSNSVFDLQGLSQSTNQAPLVTGSTVGPKSVETARLSVPQYGVESFSRPSNTAVPTASYAEPRGFLRDNPFSQFHPDNLRPTNMSNPVPAPQPGPMSKAIPAPQSGPMSKPMPAPRSGPMSKPVPETKPAPPRRTSKAMLSPRDTNVRSGFASGLLAAQAGPLASLGGAPGAWPQPKDRTRQQQFRRVIISGLGEDANHSTVCSLVWGGPLERIIYAPGAPTAEVVFLNPKDCETYYEQSVPHVRSGENLYKITRSEVIDPVGPKQHAWARHNSTRCIIAWPYPSGMLPIQLKRLATGTKESKREVESCTAGYRDVSDRKTTQAKWRFTSIDDAARFYEDLSRNPEWRNSQVFFEPDPCSAAIGVHAAF